MISINYYNTDKHCMITITLKKQQVSLQSRENKRTENKWI